MGVLFHGAKRCDLKPGDHIYTWRIVYTYSHHGIYMGGDKVVHFTQELDESSGFGAWLTTSAPSSSVPSSLKLPNPSAYTPSNLKLLNPSGSASNLSSGSFNSTGSGSNLSSFNSSGSGSGLPSSCFPGCGFKNSDSGVVVSCLDCFLGSGSLYLFEYGVTLPIFFTRLRGGTCTTAQSDPKDMVIHRTINLLQKGFGNYDILMNNCEDFALYCKTGLLTRDKSGAGMSGQAASVVGAPLAAIVSTPLRFLMPVPVVMAATAGMYCVSRYATDMGVRSDVIKVAVEDMPVYLSWVPNPGKEAAEEVSKREMANHGLGSSSRPKLKKSSLSLGSFNSTGSGSNLNSFNSSGSGWGLPSSCSNFPDCGFKNPNNGVFRSCLYLFEYGVTLSIFFARVKGGTCTTAQSDPMDMVIHRAMNLLQKGFGMYDILLNNCEDFVLYCKTGLLVLDMLGAGRSGQAAFVAGAPPDVVLATLLRFLLPVPVVMAVTAGMYCLSRYATDIGVRSGVIKVAVEDMLVDLGWGRNPGKEEMPNHGLVMAVAAEMYCLSRYVTDIGVRSDVLKVAVEDKLVDLGWVLNPGKEAALKDKTNLIS